MGTKFGLLTIEKAKEMGYIPAQTFVNGVRITNPVIVNDIEGWVDANDYDSLTRDMEEIPLKRFEGDVLYIPANGDLVL